MRLRQAVFVSADLEPAVSALRGALGLGAPYADPGVALFGLRNAVMALGGDFLEVVAPAQEGTAAGRHLDRRGPGGYMLIVQVDDIHAARERARALGVRAVWEIDLPDIATTHLHPRDTGGTLLSLDQPVPAESWRWGGPPLPSPPPGRLRGAIVEAPDPEATAERWAQLLGLPVPADATLMLGDEQRIAFVPGDRGLVAVHAEAAGKRVTLPG